jgi:hypothetical protein
LASDSWQCSGHGDMERARCKQRIAHPRIRHHPISRGRRETIPNFHLHGHHRGDHRPYQQQHLHLQDRREELERHRPAIRRDGTDRYRCSHFPSIPLRRSRQRIRHREVDAPTSDIDSAITSYIVTPYLGGVAQTPQLFNSSATTETVNGLSNGSVYTFQDRGQERQRHEHPVPSNWCNRDRDPRRTNRSQRHRGHGLRDGLLDEVVNRQRLRDHRLHRHLVRRWCGKQLRVQRIGDERGRHRTDKRNGLHVQGRSPERPRYRPELRPIQRRHAHLNEPANPRAAWRDVSGIAHRPR